MGGRGLGRVLALVLLVEGPGAAAQQAAPALMQAAPPATPPALAQQPAPASAPADDEGPPRLSLATEADHDAWKRSGFRLGLGLTYGRLIGLGGAPSGRLLGATIRLGFRLDADWSIIASLQYASASASGGLSGLRFAGTIDPTWHVGRHLSLAVGLGFGGIVEGTTSRPEIDPAPDTLGSSYTFPSASPPLPSCSGVGATGLVRAEWAIILGPRALTSVSVEGIGQWTGCVDDTNRIEPDTGTAIVRRQWWPHAGATLAWGIAWR